ncbi:hypothetical protein AB0D65_29485 [Streptomyces griseoloalbus]|uniref:Uncharacterized protein n=1 Tax=Streptomyces griseoloalbus TaxID=67303 RepID=A0ABV3ECZ4_9ACTN
MDAFLPAFVDRLLDQSRDPGDVPDIAVTESTGWLVPLANRLLGALATGEPAADKHAFLAHGYVHLPLTGDAVRPTYLRVAAQSVMTPWLVSAPSVVLMIAGTVALEMYQDTTDLYAGAPQYARSFGHEQFFSLHPGTPCATQSSPDGIQVIASTAPVEPEPSDWLGGDEYAATVEQARFALEGVAASTAGGGQW